ncbi:glycosyltransferase family 4 protein [Cellulomonas sp. 179-A 9B4 NHS]|uniref:glycosyltransferase family 4 protein n=1 Tax=Cellulomonas sp. 179-A 9B4 NHS TaxID=3142379 RepID=UPI00399F7DA7
MVHVSSAHPWIDNRIHYRECESLAAAGFDVTLVAVASDVDSYRGSTRVMQIPRRSRARRLLLGAPQAVLRAVRTRSDVVHLHDPELIWAIPLFRALGRKVVYDAHEDLPQQVRTKAYLTGWRRTGAIVLARLLVRTARYADRVVAATESVAERFPPEKVTVIHNYPPLLAAEQELTPIAQRARVALYVGSLGWNRGLRTMASLPSAPSFPEGWEVRVVGPIGSAMRDEAIAAGGVQPATIVGPLAPAVARGEMARARIGLVLLRATPAYVESLPTKMFEYFAAGMPVIASDFPAWRAIVRDGDCGLLVDPEDPDAVARALRRYEEEPELLERHSTNARRLAETRYNWGSEASALVDLYESLVRR